MARLGHERPNDRRPSLDFRQEALNLHRYPGQRRPPQSEAERWIEVLAMSPWTKGAAEEWRKTLADLAAARSALKDSFDRAYDLACVLNVERPSESSRAQPMRFTEREIL